MARRRTTGTVEDISDRLNRDMEGEPIKDEAPKTAEAGTTAGHNAKARAATIRDLARDLSEIDADAAELSARRKEITGKLKADLGITVKRFRQAYGLYMLEQEDRDQALDELRECFNALGIGQQGELFPAPK